MSNREKVKIFDSRDGKRRVVIIARGDGCYSFIEEGEMYED